MMRKRHVLGMALLAWLAASCAAKSVDVTPTARMSVDAHVGKNFTSDSTQIGNISDDFVPSETIFAIVDVPGSTDGTLRAVWVMNGTETVQEHTMTLIAGTNAYRFRLEPPAGGHKAGEYRFEVYVNGDRKDSEKFTVHTG